MDILSSLASMIGVAIAGFIAVTVALLGLFAAPWPVLMVLLVIGLLGTQRLNIT